MNLNELAVAITRQEKGKRQVNIAQTKEVIKSLGAIFKNMSLFSFLKLAWQIRQHGKSSDT
jgi:hypothetical protein